MSSSPTNLYANGETLLQVFSEAAQLSALTVELSSTRDSLVSEYHELTRGVAEHSDDSLKDIGRLALRYGDTVQMSSECTARLEALSTIAANAFVGRHAIVGCLSPISDGVITEYVYSLRPMPMSEDGYPYRRRKTGTQVSGVICQIDLSPPSLVIAPHRLRQLLQASYFEVRPVDEDGHALVSAVISE